MARGKLILVTGVTRGLGRAMVEEFIARGHTVVGCGRNAAEIKKLRQQHGEPHDFYPVDVANDDSVKSWASVVVTSHGVPELLVNNAGLINRNAALWEIEAREFDEVVDVNLKGTANVIRHFGQGMVKRKTGVIVNFSSGWGRSADAEVSPYCASKWGIEGLTQSLAQELPTGMAAVALNPGIINTDMLQSVFGGFSGTYPTADEWAKIAVPYILKIGPGDNGRPLTVPIRGAQRLMPKPKRKAVMLGLGLDSDGHKRVTTGDNFALLGGTKDTHEQMTEKAIKINEKLKARGKQLENVTSEELDDIAGEVGLKRRKPDVN